MRVLPTLAICDGVIECRAECDKLDVAVGEGVIVTVFVLLGETVKVGVCDVLGLAC